MKETQVKFIPEDEKAQTQKMKKLRNPNFASPNSNPSGFSLHCRIRGLDLLHHPLFSNPLMSFQYEIEDCDRKNKGLREEK